MSTNSYQFNNLSVVSSLNNRAIYIKVIDKHAYTCYESNIDKQEFKLNCELSQIYHLIGKCFAEETVEFSVDNGFMKCSFTTCLEGFYTIHFSVLLREKILGKDGELSIQLVELQEQISELSSELDKQTTELSSQNQKLETQLKQKESEIEDMKMRHNITMLMLRNAHIGRDVIEDDVTKLTIEGDVIIACRYVSLIHGLEHLIISDYRVHNILKYCLFELKIIQINHSSNNVFNESELMHLSNKNKLETIIISNCNSIGVGHFTNLLEARTTDTLKTIQLTGCRGVDKFGMQTLCKKHKIELIMS